MKRIKLEKVPESWKTDLDTYYVFSRLFSDYTCQGIIEQCLPRLYRPAYTLGQCAGFNPEDDEWGILAAMSGLIHAINREELGGPPLQFLKYGIFNAYGIGETYKWHHDFVKQRDGSERFLSCVLMLSDPDDYECVENRRGFEISSVEDKMPQQYRGDVVIFPSYFVHRATEITAGARYSLAMWAAR